MPYWDLILGAVMGTSGSGIIAVIWGIIKDTRAGRVVNEETAIGQMRYLKEEAEKRAAEEKAEADQRVAEEKERADRAWRLVAWYRSNYAILWQAYTIGPPPGEKHFPFSPPDDYC